MNRASILLPYVGIPIKDIHLGVFIYGYSSHSCKGVRRAKGRDYFDGIRVNVYQSGEGYDLYYLQYRLSLSVYEDRIVDFVLQHS